MYYTQIHAHARTHAPSSHSHTNTHARVLTLILSLTYTHAHSLTHTHSLTPLHTHPNYPFLHVCTFFAEVEPRIYLCIYVYINHNIVTPIFNTCLVITTSSHAASSEVSLS